jgi:ABC-2 type transport system permease protein
MAQSEELIIARPVDGIVRIRPDFSRQVRSADAEVQIVVHGGDANRARIVQGYAEAAVSQWTVRRMAQGEDVTNCPVKDRLWLNEANESRYFLVPGLIVLVITLNGSLLTTLVVAREWERGRLEALFVTPVRTGSCC